MMRISKVLAIFLGVCWLALAGPTQAAPVLDDSNLMFTAMQFTAKDGASRAELKKRLLAMRDYQRRQPGFVDNALLENFHPEAKPQFVGVARWKNAKDWEALWLSKEFQGIVRSLGEVGDLTPAMYAPVK